MNRFSTPIGAAIVFLLLSAAGANAQQGWRLRATSLYTLQFWMGHGISDSTTFGYATPADTNADEVRYYKVQPNRAVRWEGRTDIIGYTVAGDSQLVELRKYDTTTGGYVVLGRHSYTYIRPGLRSGHIYLRYDSLAGMFRNAEQEQFFYDTASRLSLRTQLLGDYPGGTQWLNYSQTRYTYNSRGNVLTSSGYFWNAGLARWLLNDSTEYSYDPGDTVYRGNISYIRNTTTNRVFPLFRTRVDAVDAGGRALQTYEERYDTAAKRWDPSAANRYQYDAATGRMTQWLLGFWDAAANDYDYRGRTDYFYHAPSGRLSKDLYTALNSSPQYMRERNYYYEAVSLGIGRLPASAGATLSAYPQPAASEMKLRVQLDAAQDYSIAVFDLQGRRLQTQTDLRGSGLVSIPVSALPAGIYTAVLRGAAGAGASLKFTVQR